MAPRQERLPQQAVGRDDEADRAATRRWRRQRDRALCQPQDRQRRSRSTRLSTNFKETNDIEPVWRYRYRQQKAERQNFEIQVRLPGMRSERMGKSHRKTGLRRL